MVTVSGFGFDATAAYECAFESSSGDTLIKVDATVLNLTSMTCVTPEWTGIVSRDSWFSITKDGNDVALHGGTTVNSSSPSSQRFAFASQWNTKNTSADLAKGGAAILVRGHAFENSTLVSYVCLFRRWVPVETGAVNVSHLQEESLATILDGKTLKCVTPHWRHAAGAANFSVSRRGDGPEVVTNASADLSFAFFSGWDNTSSHSPVSGGAGGMGGCGGDGGG